MPAMLGQKQLTKEFYVLPLRHLLGVAGLATQHEHCDRADVEDEADDATHDEVERT